MKKCSIPGQTSPITPETDLDRAARAESRTLKLSIALAVFVVASSVFVRHPGHLATERLDLLGLLVVGIVARYWGVAKAVAAAFLAFLVLGAFGAERKTFLSFAVSLDSYVDLGIFLAVAVIQGVQTGRLRQREVLAERGEQEMWLLNVLSAQLIPSAHNGRLSGESLAEIGKMVGTQMAILVLPNENGELSATVPSEETWLGQFPDVLDLARYAADNRVAIGTPSLPGADTGGLLISSWMPSIDELSPPRDDLVIPLNSPRGVEGVLYVAPTRAGGRYSADQVRLLIFIAGLLTAYLEREHLQKALVRAQALEDAERLKSSLIASVSHELKTPLAAATTVLTGLLEGDSRLDADGIRREIQSAEEDLRHLDDRIGDLLDLSRLETANWEPQIEWNDVGDLCSTVVLQTPAASRPRLCCELADDLPLLRFDFVQLSRALHHLVENALAYSTGCIRIHAAADPQRVRLWVEDEGPGVPDREKDSIFDKFYRGAAATSAPHGTGLGLAIASEIVRFHGGTLYVEDVQPHGARFVIELPRERSDEPGNTGG